MAISITTEGVVKACGSKLSLEDMQGLVGGYIEHVGIHVTIDGVLYKHLIVNEEGKLDGLPVNAKATEIVNFIGIADIIVGDVIFMEPGEFE